MRLIAEGLAAVRGERVVFQNINFDVASGQALVLHGPNGSGKTTLLRVIAGLLGMLAGRMRVIDKDGAVLTDEARDQSLHFVGHQDAIRPQLRVMETLQFHANLLGAPTKNVDAAIATWGLEPLAELSGGLLSAGQRRRVSLARLSLQRRPLWLLDEPLVALDTPTRARLNDICSKHLAQGGLIVAASHEPFLGDRRTMTLGYQE
ncbi:MAG: heme ABC exporter ATP-binding protein CcmA [Alphaproteobacteria bacterium]|nr:heme ABC exporter ATP-binding protein CcmA [Alphaproteobacteria bacterium]